MSIKRLLFSITFILTATPLLFAQEDPNAFRRFEVSLSPISFVSVDGFDEWGGQVNLVVRLNRSFGIVGDFDGHGTGDNPSTNLFSYRVGPRIYGHYGSRITTFGHFLIGGAGFESSFSAGPVTTTTTVRGFSMAWGGGLDVGITPWFALRAGQLDYDFIRIQGNTSDGLRVGGGVVFRFGRD